MYRAGGVRTPRAASEIVGEVESAQQVESGPEYADSGEQMAVHSGVLILARARFSAARQIGGMVASRCARAFVGCLLVFDIWLHPLQGANVNTTVTLDKAGRVVIPKTLRDELRLEPGDTLALESEGENVTLRPVRARTPLRKERGIWVFRTGKKIPASVTDKVLAESRERHDRGNSGDGR
jgi:AbrB family looped-hinge helix DNA binding protein